MSQKSQKLWASVKTRIDAGDFPPVFVNRAGKLALDGLGSAAELPPAIAALYPAELRAAAEAKRAERLAEEQAANEKIIADLAAREAKVRGVLAEFGDKRVWRLAGFYVEEFSRERWTWNEISEWLDWDAAPLRHNHASVSVICERGEGAGGDFHLDVSERFANPCNDKRETPSFDFLAARLRKFIAERRINAAPKN